jgi:spectinomycin phosphotransferase/16S rRNA (guanine(1405)-N(7))-methyltransferase
MVLDDDLTGWREYRQAAGPVALNREAIELYRSWWHLADIAVSVAEFRRQHEDTPDSLASWNVLAANVAS